MSRDEREPCVFQHGPNNRVMTPAQAAFAPGPRIEPLSGRVLMTVGLRAQAGSRPAWPSSAAYHPTQNYGDSALNLLSRIGFARDERGIECTVTVIRTSRRATDHVVASDFCDSQRLACTE